MNVQPLFILMLSIIAILLLFSMIYLIKLDRIIKNLKYKNNVIEKMNEMIDDNKNDINALLSIFEKKK